MTEPSSRPTGTSACSSGKTAGLTIAVFVDRQQLPSAPHEAERVAFFHKQGGKWIEMESWRAAKAGELSPEQLPAFFQSLVSLTEGAQAVAGKSIAGLAFTTLNQRGKHIFEIAEITPEALSGIAEDVAMAEARKALSTNAFRITQPVETDIEGIFTLDLVTALEEYPELSSKMILKPFLKSTPFTELTLICRHIPHWLETERGISLQKKLRGEYLILTIQKQCCGEAIV